MSLLPSDMMLVNTKFLIKITKAALAYINEYGPWKVEKEYVLFLKEAISQLPENERKEAEEDFKLYYQTILEEGD